MDIPNPIFKESQMKHTNLSQFPSLKIPVLNHQSLDIPLNTHDLMIYGYLLFRARKNTGSTQDQIRRSLLADTVTTRTHLSNLERHQLAEKRGRLWFALEPNDETTAWFKKIRNQRKPSTTGFWDRLVYTTVFLPTKEARRRGITAVTNLIYWKLVQWSCEVAGTNGVGVINPGSGSKPERLTNQYLVRAVRADPKTVRRCVETLVQLQLIKKVSLPDGYFAVSVFPLGEAVRNQLWRNRWAHKKPTVAANLEQLLGVGTKAVALPEKDYPYLEILMRYQVPKAISDEIMALTKTSGLEFFEWCSKFEKCQKDNATNLAMGKTDVPHPGRLFLYELRTLASTEGVRNLCERESNPPDSQELAAREALKRVPGRSRTMVKLLERVIANKSLQTPDGRSFPVSLTWNEVRDLASLQGITFEQFQKDLGDKLFADPRPGICDWLDRWLALSPLPEICSSGLAVLMTGGTSRVTETIMEWTSALPLKEAAQSRYTQLVIDATVNHCRTQGLKLCAQKQILCICRDYWDKLHTSRRSGSKPTEAQLDLLRIELEPDQDYDDLEICSWDPEADSWEPSESMLVGQLS